MSTLKVESKIDSTDNGKAKVNFYNHNGSGITKYVFKKSLHNRRNGLSTEFEGVCELQDLKELPKEGNGPGEVFRGKKFIKKFDTLEKAKDFVGEVKQNLKELVKEYDKDDFETIKEKYNITSDSGVRIEQLD